jgi:hypothetical protein
MAGSLEESDVEGGHYSRPHLGHIDSGVSTPKMVEEIRMGDTGLLLDAKEDVNDCRSQVTSGYKRTVSDFEHALSRVLVRQVLCFHNCSTAQSVTKFIAVRQNNELRCTLLISFQMQPCLSAFQYQFTQSY